MWGEKGMKQSVLSDSAEKTGEIATSLAEKLSGGEVIAMRGDLGAGKTCFVSALAKALGYKGETSSPTFAIVNEYLGGRLNVYHFDMYRISSWEDLYSCGYFEYLEAGGVVAVEWSENIEAALPEKYITVEILKGENGGRKIEIEGITI